MSTRSDAPIGRTHYRNDPVKHDLGGWVGGDGVGASGNHPIASWFCMMLTILSRGSMEGRWRDDMHETQLSHKVNSYSKDY